MNSSEILLAAESVVRAHVDAINAGDLDAMRRQLVRSDIERPFLLYVEAMRELAPLEIVRIEVSEPYPTDRAPGPRTTVYVTVDLIADGRTHREQLPVWVFTNTGDARIGSRILMRKREVTSLE